MNKLVAMLRVKDGILFVQDWLDVMEKLVDEIVVVDNGSTDGTLEILVKSHKVVNIKETVGFNEGRDKQILYEIARERKPDWCIWLDIDEIFENRITRKDIERLMSSKRIKMWMFRRNDMYKDAKHFAISSKIILHLAYPSRTMWKEQSNAYFGSSKIHGGEIKGVKGIKWISKYRIKHLPMLYKEYRISVCENYIKVDPQNIAKYKKDMESAIELYFPTWRWYEWNENPIVVILQNLFFNTIYFGYQLFYRQTIYRIIKRIFK